MISENLILGSTAYSGIPSIQPTHWTWEERGSRERKEEEGGERRRGRKQRDSYELVGSLVSIIHPTNPLERKKREGSIFSRCWDLDSCERANNGSALSIDIEDFFKTAIVE